MRSSASGSTGLPATRWQRSTQLGKYLKHTVLDPARCSRSFISASARAYEHYIVDAMTAGAVEQDARGRWNLIEHGQPVALEDAIQAVLSSEEGRVHAFSVEFSPFQGVACLDCRRVAIV